MVTGVVRRLTEGRNFGFIRIDNADYFFHRDDFTGNWNQLMFDYQKDVKIQVECEIVESPKGPRVAKVSRLDGVR